MANDTKKLIIGGGDFSLVISDTVPANDTAYDAAGAAFGNIKTIETTTESTQAEHIGSYKGVNILDDVFVTMIKAGFKLTCDEFDERAMRAMFFAGAGEVDSEDNETLNFIPMTGANTLRGYGRLRIYDGRDNAKPRMTWKNFSCLVRMETHPTFDGENYSSYTLAVSILGDVGKVSLKKPTI